MRLVATRSSSGSLGSSLLEGEVQRVEGADAALLERNLECVRGQRAGRPAAGYCRPDVACTCISDTGSLGDGTNTMIM